MALKESHELLERHILSVSKHSERAASLYDELQQIKSKYDETVQQRDSEKCAHDMLLKQMNAEVSIIASLKKKPWLYLIVIHELNNYSKKMTIYHHLTFTSSLFPDRLGLTDISTVFFFIPPPSPSPFTAPHSQKVPYANFNLCFSSQQHTPLLEPVF